ncbi:MAG TPA: hypothetical protein VG056_12715 [Pirellulales bacterium]|nr:hypothetical protein [Pirellulales bacterium]
MTDSSFVAYVGDADFHDGRVIDVQQIGTTVRVRVTGFSHRVFVAEFSGVRVVRSNRPEGMLLYALSERRCEAPLRRFVFLNWDEEDSAALEIDAEEFTVHGEGE